MKENTLTFDEVRTLIDRLAVYESGDPYGAFGETIINDLVVRGYSRARAEQVIDELKQKFVGMLKKMPP